MFLGHTSTIFPEHILGCIHIHIFTTGSWYETVIYIKCTEAGAKIAPFLYVYDKHNFLSLELNQTHIKKQRKNGKITISVILFIIELLFYVMNNASISYQYPFYQYFQSLFLKLSSSEFYEFAATPLCKHISVFSSHHSAFICYLLRVVIVLQGVTISCLWTIETKQDKLQNWLIKKREGNQKYRNNFPKITQNGFHWSNLILKNTDKTSRQLPFKGQLAQTDLLWMKALNNSLCFLNEI